VWRASVRVVGYSPISNHLLFQATGYNCTAGLMLSPLPNPTASPSVTPPADGTAVVLRFRTFREFHCDLNKDEFHPPVAACIQMCLANGSCTAISYNNGSCYMQPDVLYTPNPSASLDPMPVSWTSCYFPGMFERVLNNNFSELR